MLHTTPSFRSLALVGALLLGSPAVMAGPAVDALGQCLSDSTTGRDRKDLVKWIFVGIAAHPEIQPIAKVDEATTESAQREAGKLISRLIGTACLKEVRAAVDAEGPAGAKQAFEFLGKIAMQELMSNASVGAAVSGFERFIDKAAVEAAFKPR